MNKTRFGIFHIIILALLAVVAYFAFKNHQKTKELEEAKASIAKIEAIYTDWKEANTLAMSVPRIALATPLAKMQEIKKRASDVAVKHCADEARKKLVDAMNMQINGFIAFLQQENSNMQEAMISSTLQFSEYSALAEKCGKT